MYSMKVWLEKLSVQMSVLAVVPYLLIGKSMMCKLEITQEHWFRLQQKKMSKFNSASVLLLFFYKVTKQHFTAHSKIVMKMFFKINLIQTKTDTLEK